MTEEVTAPEGAEEAAEANLSLGDIGAIVSIIDICSKRGAFEGSELETVGGLRNRISTFLAQAAPPQAEEEADPEGREQPEDEA
jgi:hypothetical protein